MVLNLSNSSAEPILDRDASFRFRDSSFLPTYPVTSTRFATSPIESMSQEELKQLSQLARLSPARRDGLVLALGQSKHLVWSSLILYNPENPSEIMLREVSNKKKLGFPGGKRDLLETKSGVKFEPAVLTALREAGEEAAPDLLTKLESKSKTQKLLNRTVLLGYVVRPSIQYPKNRLIDLEHVHETNGKTVTLPFAINAVYAMPYKGDFAARKLEGRVVEGKDLHDVKNMYKVRAAHFDYAATWRSLAMHLVDDVKITPQLVRRNIQPMVVL